MKATTDADSNGNGVSLPFGIHKAEENFGRSLMHRLN
jgi:hypothetical protein